MATFDEQGIEEFLGKDVKTYQVGNPKPGKARKWLMGGVLAAAMATGAHFAFSSTIHDGSTPVGQDVAAVKVDVRTDYPKNPDELGTLHMNAEESQRLSNLAARQIHGRISDAAFNQGVDQIFADMRKRIYGIEPDAASSPATPGIDQATLLRMKDLATSAGVDPAKLGEALKVIMGGSMSMPVTAPQVAPTIESGATSSKEESKAPLRVEGSALDVVKAPIPGKKPSPPAAKAESRISHSIPKGGEPIVPVAVQKQALTDMVVKTLDQPHYEEKVKANLLTTMEARGLDADVAWVDTVYDKYKDLVQQCADSIDVDSTKCQVSIVVDDGVVLKGDLNARFFGLKDADGKLVSAMKDGEEIRPGTVKLTTAVESENRVVAKM